jgi:succinate-semialdehyde dehydrogenase / glutarate-semialdehyde dehydrogenase
LEVLDAIPDSGDLDARDAVDAARTAQREWARSSDRRRASCVVDLGARIEAAGDEFAALLTLESGAPLRETRETVAAASACLRAATASDGIPAADDPAPAVVAACLSERAPLLQLARLAVQVLIGGRTLIVKPPARAPLSCLRLAAFHDCFPAGVFGVLTGGEDVESTLRCLPHVRFSAAGEWDRAAALRPGVVLDDADLDLAAPGVTWSRLRHCGQTGDVTGPILVCRSVAAEFADRLHVFLAFLEVGDPLKPDTDLGPLLSREVALRVERQVAQAAKAGARLKLGGRGFQPWGLSGHFFQPTLLTGVQPHHPAYREPIAGPVLSLTTVADAREAMALVSDLRPAGVDLYGNRGWLPHAVA